jgi:hypothetical protein
MPIDMSVQAHRELNALGAAPTLDCFSALGHLVDSRVVEAILRDLAPDTSKRSP